MSAAVAKERPILFRGAMVRAILEGSKTQTRRVLRDQNPVDLFAATDGDHLVRRSVRHRGKVGERLAIVRCPYGKPGDRLWVRETLRRDPDANVWYYAAGKPEDWVTVSPDDHTASLVWASHKEGDVCPSIYMPRWASRLALEITKVRVERVQEISEEDAVAEGCTAVPFVRWYSARKPLIDGSYHRQEVRGLPPETWKDVETLNVRDPLAHTAKEDFIRRWDSNNFKRGYGWDKNPWVWVVEFSRIQREAAHAGD